MWALLGRITYRSRYLPTDYDNRTFIIGKEPGRLAKIRDARKMASAGSKKNVSLLPSNLTTKTHVIVAGRP